MGLTEPRGSRAVFLSIRDGSFWQRVNASHPKAKERKLTKEGYEGKVVYEVEYATLDGVITGLDYDAEGKFGPQWKITLTDDSTGEDYIVTVAGDSSDWNNIAEVLPALDATKPILINPWKSKDRRGIQIKQMSEATNSFEVVRSFYKVFNFDEKEQIYRFAGYKYDFPNWSDVDANDADDKKAYWIRVRKYLRVATLKWIEKVLAPAMQERIKANSLAHLSEDEDPFADVPEDASSFNPPTRDEDKPSRKVASKPNYEDNDLPF